MNEKHFVHDDKINTVKFATRRLRLITLTETLLIYIERTQKLGSHVSAASLTASNTNRAKLTWKSCTAVIHDMITRDLDMITRDLDMIIV